MPDGYAWNSIASMRRADTFVCVHYRQDEGSGEPGYAGGVIEPLLTVRSWKWRSGGGINTAVVSMSLSDWGRWTDAGPARIRAEHYAGYVDIDDLVEICLVTQDASGRNPYFVPVFIGFVANVSINMAGGVEEVHFLLTGFEQRLDDTIVFGQTAKWPDYDAELLAGTAGTLTVGEIAGRYETANADGETIGIELPLIFNPDGKPNATDTLAELTRTNINGEPTASFPIFEDVDRSHALAMARYWTLADAVKYLLFCYNDEKYVINPDPDLIDEFFAGVTLANVDLRGGRRLFSEILPALLEGTMFAFTVCPQPIDSSLVRDADGFRSIRKRCQLYFYRRDEGPPAMLHLDAPGGNITQAGLSNVSELLINRNTAAAANEVIVAGDYYYYQWRFDYDSNDLAESDFIEAWLTATAEISTYYDGDDFDEDKAQQFIDRHNTKGKNFPYGGYQYCFRAFALNETDEYGSEYNHGNEKILDDEGNETEVTLAEHKTAYDFNPVFGYSKYMVRRRRFYQTIERMTGGERISHYQPRLQVSYDSGSTWFWCTDFRVARNECKIIITAENLRQLYDPNDSDSSTDWMTALKNKTLRLRLYACVRSDLRVSAQASRQSDSASRFTRKAIYFDQMGLRFAKSDEQKRISSAGVDEIDGTDQAQQAANHIREITQDGLLEGSPVLAGINLAFCPGMMVPRISGREIELALNRFGGSRWPQIAGVEFITGGDGHFTRLQLDTSG